MSQLTPCPRCGRHVRASEERCPFCQLSFSSVPVPVAREEARPATLYGLPVVSMTPSDDTPRNKRPKTIYGLPVVAMQPPADVAPVFREDNAGDGAYRAPAVPEEPIRTAPKYGGPPLRRVRYYSLIVGGAAIVVYLLVHR